MRRTGTLLATTVLLGALAACNPTWTKEGKPSDASMPLPPDAKPPDAKPPAQASTSQPPSR